MEYQFYIIASGAQLARYGCNCIRRAVTKLWACVFWLQCLRDP